MIDKNLFIQDLKQVYTVLQELKVNEKMIKQLIDKYNLTEENLNLTNEELEEVKTYINSIKNFIVQNDNTTEIGGNLEVDGGIICNNTVNLNSDVSIFGELSLESADSLVFNDGSQLGGNNIIAIKKSSSIENGNTVATFELSNYDYKKVEFYVKGGYLYGSTIFFTKLDGGTINSLTTTSDLSSGRWVIQCFRDGNTIDSVYDSYSGNTTTKYSHSSGLDFKFSLNGTSTTFTVLAIIYI